MSRSRIVVGVVVVLILSILGYLGYQNFLAPQPPTPTAAAIEAQPESPAIVTAEGKIVPARDATLAFRLAGRVAEILVEEGGTVKEGDALIQLENADLQAAVAQAEAALSLAEANRDAVLAGARAQEIESAEKQLSAANATVSQASAQLAQLQSGATPDQIAAAEAAIAQAESAQKQAQIAYDKIIENIKFLAGPTEEQSRFQLNAANENLTAAQAALVQVQAGADDDAIKAAQAVVWAAAAQRDAIKAQLDLLKSGATDEQKAAADAQVAQARAALDAAEAQFAQTELRAPFAGTIVSLNVEVGEVVAPGAPVLVLADLSQWQVKTSDLSETDVVLVRPGQTVAVTLDAFADLTFNGVVTEIGSLAETNRGNTTYAVTIELDPIDTPLRWGMTAFADIEVRP